MSTSLTTHELEGRTVYSSDGEKLGKVETVLVDDLGDAQYIDVKTGWFGNKRHTIPAAGLTLDGDDLRTPYTKDQFEAAPTFDEDEYIDYDRERTIGAYYGTGVREWDDTRDRWLAGEDLSRGPTPETRHTQGGVDDVRDTTQGPTPESRETMRATEKDPAAFGEPGMDPDTRADVGGNQDAERDRGDMDRVRVRRWTKG